MIEVEKFQINLLNDTSDVYFVGQKIRGIVKFKLNRPTKIRQISLNVDGRAETCWTSKKRKRFGWTKKVYSGSESIISTNILLYPNRIDSATASVSSALDSMPPGHYAFPFTYAVSCTCFSSYEGSHGSIRYTFTAIIDRPWRPDLKCKLPFTVLELVDLNDYEPSVSKPINDHCIYRSVPISCLSTIVECQVQTERCGFVPGENITCSLWLSGNFGKRVIQIKISLVEISRFVASIDIGRRKRKFITHRRTVNKADEELATVKIDNDEKQHFVKKCLAVPALAPMISDKCRTIQVSYQLQVKVTSKDKIFLKRSYPILIGTIPLLDLQSMTNGHNQSSIVNGNAYSIFRKSSDYTALLYAENFFGSSGPLYDESDENATGPQFYTPRYPLYHVDCTEKCEIRNNHH